MSAVDSKLEGVTLVKNLTLFWHGPFSNWFKADFELDGVRYNCGEMHMMASKARTFGDVAAERAILACGDARKQKKLGRAVTPFDGAVWAAVAPFHVFCGNLAKFSQHSQLRRALLSTGATLIAEASPVDAVWGIGLAATDPRAHSPRTWRGTNHLGNALMMVRAALQLPESESSSSPFTFTSTHQLHALLRSAAPSSPLASFLAPHLVDSATATVSPCRSLPPIQADDASASTARRHRHTEKMKELVRICEEELDEASSSSITSAATTRPLITAVMVSSALRKATVGVGVARRNPKLLAAPSLSLHHLNAPTPHCTPTTAADELDRDDAYLRKASIAFDSFPTAAAAALPVSPRPSSPTILTRSRSKQKLLQVALDEQRADCTKLDTPPLFSPKFKRQRSL